MATSTDNLNLGNGYLHIPVCKECGSERLSLVDLADSEGQLYMYVCQDCGWQINVTVTNVTITFAKVAEIRQDLIGDVDPAEIEQAAKCVRGVLDRFAWGALLGVLPDMLPEVPGLPKENDHD